MKKQVYKIGLSLFVALIIAIPALAQEKVTREISNQYDVQQGFTLAVENKYGNIEVINWEKDEVSVVVLIEAEAPTKERAEKALKDTEIEIEESKDYVSYETHYGDDAFGKKTSVQVTYTVNAPKYLNVLLEQKYGNVFVQDLSGAVNVEVKYGNFNANSLMRDTDGDMNAVEIGYGNASIEEANELMVEIKYGALDISESAYLEVESAYSKIKFGEVGELQIESKYDKVSLTKLNGLVDIESDYTKVDLGEISPDFKSISAEMTYGNLDGTLSSGASFEIHAATAYGKIHIPDGDYSSVMSGNTHTIDGNVGNTPEALVNIEIKYGNVNLK